MNNMKRILSLLLALVLVLGLAACGQTTKTEEPKKDDKTTEEKKDGEKKDDAKEGEKEAEKPAGEKLTLDDNSLYLITDKGTIDDKSFNQGSFQGMEQYAKEVGVKANYLKPAGDGDQIYKQAIDQAIKKGAKIVVTPGFLFERAVWEAQTQYPEVKFVAVDFTPKESMEAKEEIKENTVSILYKEEQSGFLAGYAAVKDGYKKLGFMGGVAVPAVVKFGFGFVAGANAAAEEMGVDVDVKYNYTNSFVETPEINTMAASWYKNGTEVIFSCGGGIYASVAKAAEDNNAKMIGVDVDQKDESQTIITSAMKNLKKSVYEEVKAAVEGTFNGGMVDLYSVENKGVQISEDFSRFKTFKQADYDAIYAKLEKNEGDIAKNIPADVSNADPTSFQDQMAKVKIEYIQQ